MKRSFIVGALVAAAAPASAAAQTEGVVSGRVVDAADRRSLAGAQILVDDRVAATTDTGGAYRARGVRSGWHRVAARLIGYRSIVQDSVFVRAGTTVIVDFALDAAAQEIDPLVVSTPIDPVLDPLATATEQKISAADLRNLPVSSLDEAIALSAGTVGESYRGGRLGQQAFIIDGLGVKNQLDASTGTLGLQLPPDVLTEASLVTNAFSARYGQALSGLVNVVTKDGGDRWHGRGAYESDRALGGAWDMGLDRVVLQGDGPIAGGITAVVGVDATARLDADPVSAPRPDNPRDPRFDHPALLPHNSGERWSAVAKITAPIGSRFTARVLGLRSEDQRLLYDPAYKYDVDLAPAARTVGNLLSGHLRYTTNAATERPIFIDLRVGRYTREFLRGPLSIEPDFAFGSFTFKPFHVVGEELAENQIASDAAIPGYVEPRLSAQTPWGVPALFLGLGSRGELGWNRFGETRGQFDVTFGLGKDADLFTGVEAVRQQVRTYQRALAYLPVGGDVPPTSVSDFSPSSYAAYIETQGRVADLALTAGIRYDQFSGNAAGDETIDRGSQRSINPRIAVSTVLKGATLVASFGRFSQAPDYQYLVDATFDDTTRTGRFRRGNPNLGFEQATQYEFSLRTRPATAISLRLNVFVKRLDGLVSSVPLGVDPDSTIFGNADAGTVNGAEIIFERELTSWYAVRVAYTVQRAEATATQAFVVRSPNVVGVDTIFPAKTEFPLDFDRRHSLVAILQGRVPDSTGPRLFGVQPLAGFEASTIVRYASGLPFTRLDPATGRIVGLPNEGRLPAQSTIDLLVRRPLRLGNFRGGVYFDVRNLFNRRNVEAVRRDNGKVDPNEETIQALALAAYNANPEPIPFESARYRSYADLNQDGLIEGAGELLPLYLAAARDFTQPLFQYGPPRLARIGLEFLF